MNTSTAIQPADNLKKLNDLLAVLGQSMRDGVSPVEEIETCLGIAWDLGNSAYNKIMDQNLFPPTPSPCPSVEDSDVTICDRIFDMRNLREMTQAEIAESVGVSPNLVNAWEKNSLEPRAKHIIPLANALKCDPIWLLTGNPADVKAAQLAPQPAPVNVMKDADMANIGVRIRNLRNYEGMSDYTLAKEIDASDTMIQEWEAGKAIPPSKYIDRLAKALNASATWLVTGKVINDAGIQ
ncbi:TPA: helix-turn-helix domain-containing protein [Salmonella enterica subsp. diarizonae serovar 60-67:z35:-]